MAPTENNVGHGFTDEKEDAPLPRYAPDGIVDDPSYKTKTNEAIPVVDDAEPLEDNITLKDADSDKQLGKKTLRQPSLSGMASALTLRFGRARRGGGD